LPQPDTREQERVAREALAQETREREQEERRRQEQVDLTERERQAEAERRQRLSEMELMRQQQLADIRRRRAQAARDAQIAEQRLQQLAEYQSRSAADAAASAAPPPGSGGADAGLLARYMVALQEAIARNWTRPDSVPLGQKCRLLIRQIPGGEVTSVEVAPSCPYDELGRRSVEAAVLKAQPLPYAGFESVFSRQLNLNFEAQDR
jgi:colicin import membrane protein